MNNKKGKTVLTYNKEKEERAPRSCINVVRATQIKAEKL